MKGWGHKQSEQRWVQFSMVWFYNSIPLDGSIVTFIRVPIEILKQPMFLNASYDAKGGAGILICIKL